MINSPLEVWVLDDDEAIRWVLQKALEGSGMQCRGFGDGGEFREALQEATPDVLVTDVRMPDIDGLELLRQLQDTRPDLPVIVVTAYSDLDSTVAAYRGGAFEYLPKPFDVDEVVALVRRAARQRPDAAEPPKGNGYPALIGQAPRMQEVFRAIGRLAKSSMTVLVTGESGTGKELVARALHETSPRSGGPFIALNTSAIPSELLETELFGHERGAFTGAESRRSGRFEQADGGTLFLDEIGDMSPALQTRLLRVLAEGEFYRVGGQTPITVDVRVVTATHHDLRARVSEGAFREDLFHRLNVMHIETPPLRNRREDVPLLLKHYLRVAAGELEVSPKTLTTSAEQALREFDWPGNVRQLVNICRRLTVTAPGREIQIEDLPEELGGSASRPDSDDWSRSLGAWASRQLQSGRKDLVSDAQPEFERVLIKVALARSRGHRQKAAAMLGWGRNTLTRKIRDLGLDSDG
ncbi:MAG: nitrogen regulation protein NR(I) [Chromatiales bacterium]|jgi:two-component system nitrogen regulation response regulator GlnG|nr:nitrogen regulation protein NR(I) [Chromatiales bacterium]